MNSEKKVDFLPYATQFLGFIISSKFIPDINFKVNQSALRIIPKLILL